MELRKLNDLFYEENTHLIEVLDKNQDGEWDGHKTRGYGIIICEVDGLRFGIPLRSIIRHDACFKTQGTKGLDFSKCVLLTKDEYISNTAFKIPSIEHTRIIDSAQHIQKQFTRYINRYIQGVERNDARRLKDYRYSTLQNYHAELGISEPELPA